MQDMLNHFKDERTVEGTIRGKHQFYCDPHLTGLLTRQVTNTHNGILHYLSKNVLVIQIIKYLKEIQVFLSPSV